MATIPSSSFYNGKTKSEYKSFMKKLSKIEENANELKNRPLPKKNKCSVFDPHPVWSCFSLQRQAIDYRNKCKSKINKNVHIFAQELSNDGKRQYIVTTHKQFWDYYSKLKSSKKNFYELIPEESQCRLYFDLEFLKEFNPGLDGLEVLEVFIELICFYLKEIFGVVCDRRSIIDLDSSTDAKFSRHLIFHLPNAVFVNNKSCGNLMRYIYEMSRMNLQKTESLNNVKEVSIKEKNIPPPKDLPINKLFVKNRDGEPTFFCDLSVYSRNRNFRIFGSTKLGKNTPLIVSEQNSFDVKTCLNKSLKVKEDLDYTFFISSLVCFDEDSVHENVKILQFGDVTTLFKRNICCSSEGYQRLQETGYKTSPFPQLDKFISKNISKGGIQGVIRQWVHFPQSNTILYDIDRNHWCENIGRAHKSNHIYMVVDMKHSVFYQKCHDPDCQIVDFKSKEIPLPVDVNPLMNNSDYIIDDFDDSIHELMEAEELAEYEDLFDDFNEENWDFGDVGIKKKSQINQSEHNTVFDDDEFVLSDIDLKSLDANEHGREGHSMERKVPDLNDNGLTVQPQNPNTDDSLCQMNSSSTVKNNEKEQKVNEYKILSRTCKDIHYDIESDSSHLQRPPDFRDAKNTIMPKAVDAHPTFPSSSSASNQEHCDFQNEGLFTQNDVPSASIISCQTVDEFCKSPGEEHSCSETLSTWNLSGKENVTDLSPYVGDTDFSFSCELKDTCRSSRSSFCDDSVFDSEAPSPKTKVKQRANPKFPLKTDPENYVSSSTPYLKPQRLRQDDQLNVHKKIKSDVSILKDEFFDIELDDDDDFFILS